MRIADLERDPESTRLVHEAQEVAIERCMRSRGFAYNRVPYDGEDEANAAFELGEPDDVEAANALGYGLAFNLARGEPDRGAHAHDPNAELYASMPAHEQLAFTRALLGSEQDIRAAVGGDVEDPNIAMVSISGGPSVAWDRRSCVSEGRRAVYDDELSEGQLRLRVSGVHARINREVAADPHVRANLQRWQECMRARGYRYDEPRAASRQLASNYHAGALTLEQLQQVEIAVASADAQCQRTSDWAATQRAARQRVELAVARDEQGVLSRYVQLNAASRANASRLLDAPPARAVSLTAGPSLAM